jgi:DNA modification methylase
MGRNGQSGLSPRHGNRADRFPLECGIVGWAGLIPAQLSCGGGTILRIEYVALADLKRHPRNPKDHDIGAISGSVNRWGFAEPVVIDERTGYLAAGHGRIDTLAQLKARGGEPPVNVQLADFDGDWLIPVVRGNTFNSDSELEAFLVAANRLTILGGWNEPELAGLLQDLAAQDTALLEATGYDADDLQALLDELGAPYDEAGSGANDTPRANLSDRFVVPPFSVLDARAGYWQERKRQWLAYGIQSELGRGENLQELSQANDEYRYNKDEYLARIGRGKLANKIRGRAADVSGGAPLPLDRTANGKGPARKFAQDLMRGEHTVGGGSTRAINDHAWQAAHLARPQAKVRYGEHNMAFDGGPMPADVVIPASGTSIFDPVICELAYRWFSPQAGAVLDPFAGGSVRGIVAALLGRAYTGIDLRAEQVVANEEQAARILGEQPAPRWFVGDSRNLDQLLPPEAYDLVFTCPPYFDLEIYSDDTRDLSNTGDYAAFIEAYRSIMQQAAARLKANRFAVIVVGDVRDKRGLYRNFVSDTISAAQDAGLALYNEAVLVTAVGSLPIRAGKQFSATRKLGKTHQNVLVFVKGDPRKATAACGEVDVTMPDEPEDTADGRT